MLSREVQASVKLIVKETLRKKLHDIADNLRERRREPDVYYGTPEEIAAIGKYNEAIEAVAEALDVEADAE